MSTLWLNVFVVHHRYNYVLTDADTKDPYYNKNPVSFFISKYSLPIFEVFVKYFLFQFQEKKRSNRETFTRHSLGLNPSFSKTLKIRLALAAAAML